MPSASEKVHGVNSQKDGEIKLGMVFRNGNPKVQFAAPPNHILQHLVDRVLVLAGPTGDLPSHFSTKAVQEGGSAQLARMVRQTRKQPF
jgi:hypothetical protein